LLEFKGLKAGGSSAGFSSGNGRGFAIGFQGDRWAADADSQSFARQLRAAISQAVG
jgi:hypothetical protein